MYNSILESFGAGWGHLLAFPKTAWDQMILRHVASYSFLYELLFSCHMDPFWTKFHIFPSLSILMFFLTSMYLPPGGGVLIANDQKCAKSHKPSVLTVAQACLLLAAPPDVFFGPQAHRINLVIKASHS